MFLTQSDKVFENYTCFMIFLAHFFAQNFKLKMLTAQKNWLLEGVAVKGECNNSQLFLSVIVQQQSTFPSSESATTVNPS